VASECHNIVQVSITDSVRAKF